MECVQVSKLLTTAGLGLDIVGILILFKFQIDFNKHIHSGPRGFALKLGEESDPAMENKYERYVCWTRTGQIMIGLGFLLQIVGVWI